MNTVIPSLWFDMNAEEAMNFYTGFFKNSKINRIDRYPDESLDEHFKGMSNKVINGEFELDGQRFLCLDGGPVFSFNQSVSFILNFDPSHDEQAADTLDQYWEKLSEGGTVLMPLQEYPFSKKYGWVQDKFGLSWQLMLTDPSGEDRPFITPSLLFAGQNTNHAESALEYYVSVFPGSKLGTIARYPEATGPAQKDSIMFADFLLTDTWMAAMDSGVEMDSDFSGAISFTIYCKDQEEVDYYWEKLSRVPEAEQCGWCADEYGVSWQIVPNRLGELLTDPDTEKANRAMQAMMQMHKLDIAELEAAFEGK